MKELKEIYRSENVKNGVFTVELEKDSLYEWNVKLFKVDPDSQLATDIKQMEQATKQNYLLFHFIFKDSFPLVFSLYSLIFSRFRFEPPFVHLVSPSILNGFVLSGGALCMEILTKSGRFTLMQ
jgi:ubiquitin-conjugating enzyme E2 Q